MISLQCLLTLVMLSNNKKRMKKQKVKKIRDELLNDEFEQSILVEDKQVIQIFKGRAKSKIDGKYLLSLSSHHETG